MSSTQALVEPRDSPYFGLDYYREKFGAWFFGREAEGGKVITNLRAARLTLLHAESGVGKSSLLRAGVAWRMRRLADDSLERRSTVRSVPVVFSSWKDDPVPQLVAAIASAIRPYLAGSPEPELPADRLDAAIAVASGAANTSLLLMLDQFEEYFLYFAHEPTPGRFADQLAACINRADLRANFLIAIREDAYASLGDLFKGRIANVYGNYLHIEYLDRPSAEMAIREPLQLYNGQPHVCEPVKIEDELVEAVLDQVRAYDIDRDAELGRAAAADGGAARVSTPLLQLVMEAIWQRERAEDSHELRLSTLQNLRGVRMIVDTHLEKALSDLSSGERRTAVDLFDHMVTPSGGKIAESVPDLAKRTGHSEGQVGGVLAKLDDSRIVRPVPAPPGQDPVQFRRYEIFHDVLAPAISQTIAAREERRRTRRLRRFAALAMGLLIVALAVTGVFAYLLHKSDTEKLTAESRELAADADVNTARDPELSVLLALQALHLQDTNQAEEALRAALPELQAARTFQIGTTVNSAAFDPADANKVASADRSGTAWIWDVKTGHHLVPMSLGGFNVTGGALALAFDQAGTRVAVGYADGQVGVFDARDGKKLHSYTFADSPAVNGVNFVGDTDVLAIATQKGAYLWAPENGSEPFRLLRNHQNTLSGGANAIVADPHDPLKYAIATGNGTVIVELRQSDFSIIQSQSLTQGQPAGTADANAAFSPDGQQVVTADGDGKVRVYSVATGKTVMTLDAGDAEATSVAFSPDGSLIAAGYSSGMTRVWEVSTRLQLTELAGNAAWIEAVQFSPNGREVVTASDDGRVRVWYAWPRELQAQFASSYANGVPNQVLGAQYISAGRIVALDDAGNLNVFTPGGTRLAGISPAGTTVESAAWDNAGTQIVTVGSDGTVRVWHAGDADYARMLPSSPAVRVTGVQDVAMSADGSRFTLVASDNYYAVQVRSAQTGQLMKTLDAANSIDTVAFSPGGQQIVAGDYNGQVEVWGATGHRRLLGTAGPSISDVEFNNSGSEFVTVSQAGTVTVWAAPADRSLSTFQACPSPNAASPSPDGSKIVVACEDGSALVFDAVTGQQLTVLPAANTGTVSSAGFSPDGKSIITVVDAEGTGWVQVWNAELANPSTSVIERIANGRTTRQLTPAERSTYLAGITG